ncbi:methylmalonyl-CoA mutase subunit beta [Polaribacter batillariae]|uniref:Methylmalonyl-CoA mutase subunit beta n=1 Tax=Polaribacter batillariae TaxID=2808900 RepID=A0ABX7SYK2_9FLAO|nr:methylmalonyl-CoA mutase subunit beta [Polaribacter batillariae]QTD38573.1 methylmalonyl-CoA mutase subunit beta [Polaribacter batillariae]
MSTFLFDNFNGTSPAAWKQKIQVDLKGADYNETLLWKTNDGLTVRPFYTKEDRNHIKINLPKENFKTCQTIFINDEEKANLFALDSLKRGATALQFVAKSKFDFKAVLKEIQYKKVFIYFKFNFLDDSFTKKISEFVNSKICYFQTDILGNFSESGNWFVNLKEDHKKLESIVNSTENSISVSGDLYQNAGANNIQQLAYTLAHANEYLNHFGASIASKIHFQFSVGGNYFHEIAKLRAFRLLWSSLLNEYNIKEKEDVHLFVQPSLRNKTLYDYNVNMLRTTCECMSAILGGANTIANISYNAIYAKQDEFGERIARNQLLILQEESGLKNAQNFANGVYYIESLTQQIAEKALIIFKQIEKGGGFLKQLKEGNIQRKIKESAVKEEKQFAKKELILLGTNLQANKQDFMKSKLEIDPFLKQRNIKTLIAPLIRKRLSENHEKQRLKNESNF